jgi:hypothetical protein
MMWRSSSFAFYKSAGATASTTEQFDLSPLDCFHRPSFPSDHFQGDAMHGLHKVDAV